MGHVVVRQPDGRLAVWSTVVDDFVALNADPDDIARLWVNESAVRVEREAAAACSRALRVGTSSRLDPDSGWHEYLAMRRDPDGPDPRGDLVRLRDVQGSRGLGTWRRIATPEAFHGRIHGNSLCEDCKSDLVGPPPKVEGGDVEDGAEVLCPACGAVNVAVIKGRPTEMEHVREFVSDRRLRPSAVAALRRLLRLSPRDRARLPPAWPEVSEVRGLGEEA